ncbi:hypothetical protein RMATCC62417_13703 [Rhizopus microsporus]|nr:hypothetical protein RMATCC62417_13703 [Rhizopus microsporus]
MSLFEIDYVSGAAHELRLKQQQDQIMKALKELSIKIKQESQEVQKPVMNYSDIEHDSWLTFSSSYTTLGDKNGNYSPYYDSNQGQYITKRRPSSSLRSRQWSASSCSYRSRSIPCCSASSAHTTIYDDHDESRNIESTNVEISKDERDVYGFKKPTKWIHADSLREIEQCNKVVMEKQLEKWQKFTLSADDGWPSIGPQLFRFVKDGIPRELRPKIWMHYSGASRKKLENQGLYDLLVKQAEDAGKSNEYAAVIERDLCRTFPDNIYFADDSSTAQPTKIHMLRRVLLAFSMHSPEIGYCQSFNFLAGLLTLLLDSEEDAFWMMHTIVHDYFPEGMFDTKMIGANIEQTVLMMLVYEKLPGVWAKIASRKCFWECEQENNLPPITLVTNHWFMTLFINILPIETVLCVWDCFFVGGGFKVLYQAALTIIKMNEENIWEAEDSVDAFQILQNAPKKLIDGRHFIEVH